MTMKGVHSSLFPPQIRNINSALRYAESHIKKHVSTQGPENIDAWAYTK